MNETLKRKIHKDVGEALFLSGLTIPLKYMPCANMYVEKARVALKKAGFDIPWDGNHYSWHINVNAIPRQDVEKIITILKQQGFDNVQTPCVSAWTINVSGFSREDVEETMNSLKETGFEVEYVGSNNEDAEDEDVAQNDEDEDGEFNFSAMMNASMKPSAMLRISTGKMLHVQDEQSGLIQLNKRPDSTWRPLVHNFESRQHPVWGKLVQDIHAVHDRAWTQEKKKLDDTQAAREHPAEVDRYLAAHPQLYEGGKFDPQLKKTIARALLILSRAEYGGNFRIAEYEDTASHLTWKDYNSLKESLEKAGFAMGSPTLGAKKATLSGIEVYMGSALCSESDAEWAPLVQELRRRYELRYEASRLETPGQNKPADAHKKDGGLDERAEHIAAAIRRYAARQEYTFEYEAFSDELMIWHLKRAGFSVAIKWEEQPGCKPTKKEVTVELPANAELLEKQLEEFQRYFAQKRATRLGALGLEEKHSEAQTSSALALEEKQTNEYTLADFLESNPQLWQTNAIDPKAKKEIVKALLSNKTLAGNISVVVTGLSAPSLQALKRSLWHAGFEVRDRPINAQSALFTISSGTALAQKDSDPEWALLVKELKKRFDAQYEDTLIERSRQIVSSIKAALKRGDRINPEKHYCDTCGDCCSHANPHGGEVGCFIKYKPPVDDRIIDRLRDAGFRISPPWKSYKEKKTLIILDSPEAVPACQDAFLNYFPASRKTKTAFLMGLHPRLGAESKLHPYSQHLLRDTQPLREVFELANLSQPKTPAKPAVLEQEADERKQGNGMPPGGQAAAPAGPTPVPAQSPSSSSAALSTARSSAAPSAPLSPSRSNASLHPNSGAEPKLPAVAEPAQDPEKPAEIVEDGAAQGL